MNEPNHYQDIVEGLRSDDAEERTEALDELFPNSGGTIMLHVKDLQQTQVSTTKQCDASRCFGALLFLAQSFGKHIGLHLAWVPDPKNQPKIVVPNGPVRLPR